MHCRCPRSVRELPPPFLSSCQSCPCHIHVPILSASCPWHCLTHFALSPGGFYNSLNIPHYLRFVSMFSFLVLSVIRLSPPCPHFVPMLFVPCVSSFVPLSPVVPTLHRWTAHACCHAIGFHGSGCGIGHTQRFGSHVPRGQSCVGMYCEVGSCDVASCDLLCDVTLPRFVTSLRPSCPRHLFIYSHCSPSWPRQFGRNSIVRSSPHFVHTHCLTMWFPSQFFNRPRARWLCAPSKASTPPASPPATPATPAHTARTHVAIVAMSRRFSWTTRPPPTIYLFKRTAGRGLRGHVAKLQRVQLLSPDRN